MADPVKNFAKATVSTGYDASATSVVLSSGKGALFPAPATDGAFNLTWYNSTDYGDPADDPNAEIVRVTARSTDTLTVTRAQESTSAATHNTSAKTYTMILGPTKKTIDDLVAEIALYIKKDGTVPLTAAWDAGNFTVTADKFSADTGFVGTPSTGSNVVGATIYHDGAIGTGSAGGGSVIIRTAAPDVLTLKSSTANGGTTVTHNLSEPSGRNRLVLVAVTQWAGSDSLTGVTYNGTAMTSYATVTSAPAICKIFYIKDADLPAAAGTYSVVGTNAETVHVLGFVWVDQTTPLGTAVTATGTSTTPSVAVTSAAGEIVVDILSCGVTTVASVGAGQTVKTERMFGNSTGKTSSEAGATSTTMSWTLSVSGDYRYGLIGVAVKPAANTPTTANVLKDRLTVMPNGTISIGALATSGDITMSSVNAKITSSASGGLILESTGDTYGTVRLVLTNIAGVNGALFEQRNTAGIDLVDFVFSTEQSAIKRNIRFESRSGQTFAGDPEFQIGSPGNPAMAISDALVLVRTANLQIADAKNIVFDTTTGTKIGTATGQKIAFHNSTPVIQRTGAAQAAVATTAATNVAPYGYTQAQADAIIALVNEIRAALVEKGLIKGSA